MSENRIEDFFDNELHKFCGACQFWERLSERNIMGQCQKYKIQMSFIDKCSEFEISVLLQ